MNEADKPDDEQLPPAKPPGKVKPPPFSLSKRQAMRRKLLRTVLLTSGVLGAALSGYLPLVYARKPRLRPPGRSTKRISSPLASSAASACRSARCRRSSWPTW